jgi:hypothetical protein
MDATVYPRCAVAFAVEPEILSVQDGLEKLAPTSLGSVIGNCSSSACSPCFPEMLMMRWLSSEISIFHLLQEFRPDGMFFGFRFGLLSLHWRIRLVAAIAPLAADRPS